MVVVLVLVVVVIVIVVAVGCCGGSGSRCCSCCCWQLCLSYSKGCLQTIPLKTAGNARLVSKLKKFPGEVSRCRESCAWKQVVGQESGCGAVALGDEGFAEVPSMDVQEGSVRRECA